MEEISFEEALDIQLSERQVRLSTSTHVERNYQRRDIEQSLLEVFELVGGVPRLAIWANNPKNYGKFLTLLAKLLPKEVPEDIAKQIIYQSTVPQSPLCHPQLRQKKEEIVDAEVIPNDPSEQ